MTRKFRPRFFGAMLCGAVGGTMIAAPVSADDPPAIGGLSIVPTDGGYRITATVDGRSAAAIDAELTVSKSDDAGRVRTSQSRQVITESGRHNEIATSQISMADEGTLKVSLVLSVEDRIVYRVSQTVTREIPD